MVEYRILATSQLLLTSAGQGRVETPAEVNWLYADKRDREIIETNAPFLRDCCGSYSNCEAVAAALAFNFTEKP